MKYTYAFLPASYRLIGCWLVLLIGLSRPCWAQCPTDVVSLYSQADVNNFPPGCSALPGLFITGNDITDLRPLGNLKTISGPLLIFESPMLVSLKGLENLITVSEGLYIESNERLNDISALSQLTSIGAELRIGSNPQLSQCALQNFCQYLAIPPT